MINKIVELVINFEELEFDDLGIEVMSLVDRPAIDVEWMAFSEEVVEDTVKFRENPDCPDGWEHEMGDGSWMCGKEMSYTDEEKEALESSFLKLASSDKYGRKITENSVVIDGTQNKFASVSDIAQGIRALDILDGDAPAQKMYRYSGGPNSNSRNFCYAMVALNKIFTKVDIEAMETAGINANFGHRGRPYSIFLYKGGVNCKHYWSDLSVFNRGGREVIIDNGPAAGDAGQIAQPSNDYWRFSADDEMIVTGPAMIPKMMIPRKDEDGNLYHVFFSTETIKMLAKKFLQDNNAHYTDINHNASVTSENTLLESWIIEDSEMDKARSLGFKLPKGTWMTSYKINNQETWNKIKAGQLNGFSVEGQFIEKLQS